MMKVSQLQTWKSIKIGIGPKTPNGFREALWKAGCEVTSHAHNILNSPGFAVSQTIIEVELVPLTVGDLGFGQAASYNDICSRAKRIGLAMCHFEVGPQLCLQCGSHLLDHAPWNEPTWIMIGMELVPTQIMPVVRPQLDLFMIEKLEDGKLYLTDVPYTYNYGSGLFDLDCRWLFIKP